MRTALLAVEAALVGAAAFVVPPPELLHAAASSAVAAMPAAARQADRIVIECVDIPSHLLADATAASIHVHGADLAGVQPHSVLIHSVLAATESRGDHVGDSMRAARIWFASALVLAGCTTTHVGSRDPSSARPAAHTAVPGTRAVPAVRGLQALYALRRLHAARFMIVTFTARLGDEAAGIVVAQRPRSGSAVGPSTTVRLLVSAGRPPPGGEFVVPGVGTCEMGYVPPHSACAGGPVMVHIHGQ